MNAYRKMLIEAVEQNGGYHARWDSYPIEYTVGLYYTKNRVEDYAEDLISSGELDPKLWSLIEDEFVGDFDMDAEWQHVQEDMSHMLDYPVNTYGQDTATKFGLPYRRFPNQYKRLDKEVAFWPVGKKGWALVDPYINLQFDVEFSLEGRGGKHLVIAEFEGHKLAGMSSEAFIEALEDPDTLFSNEWCRNLLAMMQEWDVLFTSRAASAEFDYQMEYNIMQGIEDFVDSDNFTPQMALAYNNLELDLQP